MTAPSLRLVRDLVEPLERADDGSGMDIELSSDADAGRF